MRDDEVLSYHSEVRPGKIEVVPTKPCLTQRDLSMAYSPGVAVPARRIAADPAEVDLYTVRANLVAVVTNGTAVLGLGDVGPLAAKPVMEGKAVLFKRLAGIDVFDLELAAKDPAVFCDAVAALEPTFGGINLEDIKAPECFEIEETLRSRLSIPVFHDDQHGTAIIAAAALINALELQDKDVADVRVVFAGAGAAGIACARMFTTLGVRHENVLMYDSDGPLTAERASALHPAQREFCRETDRATLAEGLEGADVFCGVAAGGIVDPAMVRSMADRPVVFALANPDPEIPYEQARGAREGVIAATGRSDYPNQVNNALGFPYIFRGALDVRARTVDDGMKVAAARALAELAREDVPDMVLAAYGMETMRFGPEYLIPKPLDPRMLQVVPPAVAKAAMDAGIARRTITDWTAYRNQLERLQGVGRAAMRRIFEAASHHPRRIVFPEGDDPRVLRAAEILLDDELVEPLLLGEPERIEALKAELGLSLDGATVVDVDDPELQERHAAELHRRRARRGITPQTARREVRRRPTLGLMMLMAGEADGLVGGLGRPYAEMLRPSLQLLGPASDVRRVTGCVVAFHPQRTIVIADTTVSPQPSVDDLVDIGWEAARVARTFGLEPRVAFLSFSNFGDSDHPDAGRQRRASRLFRERHPEIVADGEMHPDTALNPKHAAAYFPHSFVQGDANVLVVPDLDAGLILYKTLTELTRVETIGPMLSGLSHPVNILNYASSVDDIVRFAALTAVFAASRDRG